MAGIGGPAAVQKGIDKIKEATVLDEQVTQSGSTQPGRYDGAVKLYLDGIQYFSHAMKCESSSPPNCQQVERWRGAPCGGVSRVRLCSDVPSPPLPLMCLPVGWSVCICVCVPV